MDVAAFGPIDVVVVLEVDDLAESQFPSRTAKAARKSTDVRTPRPVDVEWKFIGFPHEIIDADSVW
jgi:hypothetical protein